MHWGENMQMRMIEVVALAAWGVLWLLDLTVAQLSREAGDASHQRRGMAILLTLLALVAILEGGLRQTAFKREALSFWIHMAFAIPTAAVVMGLVATGAVARSSRSARRSSAALKWHRRLNRPAGKGALLWMSGSIITGVVFFVRSLLGAGS